MPGSVSHAKKHGIQSANDHRPMAGAVLDHIVTVDANGLPKDSGTSISTLIGGLIYKGTWDATNPPVGGNPTLADGVGTQGWFYQVSVAGTQNLGSGDIDFEVDDWVLYNGTIWEKIDHTDQVLSVDSRMGAVNLGGTYVTMAIAISTVQPVIGTADGDTYLLGTGCSGVDWAGHDNEIAQYSSGVWVFRTPRTSEIAYVGLSIGTAGFQGKTYLIWDAGAWRYYVPKRVVVSDTRGDDSIGGEDTPFKTLAGAILWGQTQYSGSPFEIYIDSDMIPLGALTATIWAGMTVTLVMEQDYGASITLTVEGFTTTTIRNMTVDLIEADSGDTKNVFIIGGSLYTITPEVVPSIYLTLHYTFIFDYATFLSQTAGIYGFYETANSSSFDSVMGQPGEPDKDDHLVNKGYIDDNVLGKVRIHSGDTVPKFLYDKIAVQNGIKKTQLDSPPDSVLVLETFQQNFNQANYVNGGLAVTYASSMGTTPPNVQVSIEDLAVVAGLRGYQHWFTHTIVAGLYVGCTVHVYKMYVVGANVYIAECATNDCKVHVKASKEAL